MAPWRALANLADAACSAQQNRGWEFDLEEGMMRCSEARRLSSTPEHP